MNSCPPADNRWYREGLRFKCTGCGKCCTGKPGYVWLQEEDIARLAKRFRLSIEDFLRKYARRVNSRYSLTEKGTSYDCVFLKEGKLCAVYEDRPKQCKTFPFWKENLTSPQAWEEAKTSCEGIDHKEAPLYKVEEIEKA